MDARLQLIWDGDEEFLEQAYYAPARSPKKPHGGHVGRMDHNEAPRGNDSLRLRNRRVIRNSALRNSKYSSER